jgi:hypothetical protein
MLISHLRRAVGHAAALVLLSVTLPRAAHATWSVIAVDAATGRVVIASATCVNNNDAFLMGIQAVVVPGKGGGLRLVEAKAARTVTPSDAAPMQRLAAAWSKRPGARGRVERVLIHRPARAGVTSRAVAPGVQAFAKTATRMGY